MVDWDYSSQQLHVVGVKMAASAPPSAKKAKRSAPVCLVSAEEHAKQFNEDLLLTVDVVLQTL